MADDAIRGHNECARQMVSAMEPLQHGGRWHLGGSGGIP